MIEVTKACKVDCFYESKGFLRCSIGKLGTCEPSLETFVVQLGTFVVRLGNWERVNWEKNRMVKIYFLKLPADRFWLTSKSCS